MLLRKYEDEFYNYEENVFLYREKARFSKEYCENRISLPQFFPWHVAYGTADFKFTGKWKIVKRGDKIKVEIEVIYILKKRIKTTTKIPSSSFFKRLFGNGYDDIESYQFIDETFQEYLDEEEFFFYTNKIPKVKEFYYDCKENN